MPEDYFVELLSARVRPADQPWETGMQVKGGSSLPFIVEQSWAGPAGTYVVEWSLRRDGRAVYSAPAEYVRIRGIQATSVHTSTVSVPIRLEEGEYELVFLVEGYLMGSAKVQAVPAGNAAA